MEAAGIEPFNNSPEKATALLPSAAESAAMSAPDPLVEFVLSLTPEQRCRLAELLANGDGSKL